MLHDDFRRCLETGDVDGARKIWAHVAPHLPQPKTHGEAEIVLHCTRTQTETIDFKLRAWSHRWLTERGYPSRLPDELKPKAERLYPRIVEGVGIAVKSSSEELAPVAAEVQKAMANAVEEAYADGQRDPVFMRARMADARRRTLAQMLGLRG